MPMHNPAHPGELLYELVLHPLELTLTEAARRLGVSRHTLSRLVHTQTSLTPEMALRRPRRQSTARRRAEKAAPCLVELRFGSLNATPVEQ